MQPILINSWLLASVSRPSAVKLTPIADTMFTILRTKILDFFIVAKLSAEIGFDFEFIKTKLPPITKRRKAGVNAIQRNVYAKVAKA
jgi:hypothetical protein